MNKSINTDKAPKAIGPYSQAIKCDDGTMYVSGQLPIDPKTGDIVDECVKCQSKQSILNIKAILQQEGYDLKDVVKTTVLLTDINDFAAMNEVYNQYFSQPYPARCAYQVSALPKGAKVEMEAIAKK